VAEIIDFKNLVGIEAWQEIQSNFSSVTQMPMRTVDLNGQPLTKPSNAPHLCTDFISGFPHLLKACSKCMPTFLGGDEKVDKHLSYSCMLGLRNFIAVLRLDQLTPLAYCIIGPVVLIDYKPKSEYEKIAQELGLNTNELYSAITDLKLSSFNSMLSVVELIQDVGNYLIKAAHKKIASQAEATNIKLEKLTRLMQVFLDVAFQVSKADTGSVMILDKNNEELSIFTSRGIDESIVKNSRIKYGEGISGTVAKERMPVLINDRLNNNRIKSYLKRPALKDAMVLPIRHKDDILGVLNLSTKQGSIVSFTSEDLKLMNRLIDLVSVALH